jgi:hypothetical protein
MSQACHEPPLSGDIDSPLFPQFRAVCVTRRSLCASIDLDQPNAGIWKGRAISHGFGASPIVTPGPETGGNAAVICGLCVGRCRRLYS